MVTGESSSPSSRLLRPLAYTLGALLLIIIIVVLGRKLWSYSIYTYLSNRLHDDIHLDADLAAAIASLIWMPFAYFLALSMNVLGKSKRLWGAAGLSLYFAGFSFASYIVDRNVFFTPDGPAKFVAITPNGCVFSDEPGVDPSHGSPRRPVTQTIMEACQGSDGFTDLREIPMLYDVDTGEPLVWYAHDQVDAIYRFFLSPGFDSRTGEQRKRLSRTVLERIRREHQAKAEEQQAEAAAISAARDSVQAHLAEVQSPTGATGGETGRTNPLNTSTVVDDLDSPEPEGLRNSSIDGQWRVTKSYSMSTCTFNLPRQYVLYLSGRGEGYFRVSLRDSEDMIWEYHHGRLRGNNLSLRANVDLVQSSGRRTFSSEFTGRWVNDRIEGTEKIDIVNECFMEATWIATRAQ